MRYFKHKEFDSPDKEGSGKLMNPLFLTLLDECRHLAGIRFIVTSGYRTKEYNEKLKAMGYYVSNNSPHLRGLAADIACTKAEDRWKIVNAASIVGITRIGIADDFIHLDWDWSLTQRKIWTYGNFTE